jgi:hypothetical protein
MKEFKKVDGEFVPIKHNHYLINRRMEDRVQSFAITIRTKPTRYTHHCCVCGIDFKVGDRQIVTSAGLLYGYPKKGERTRFSTLPEGWLNKLQKDIIISNKKFYTHPTCYGCHLNHQYFKARLFELVNNSLCESCEHKFKCYTGEEYNENYTNRVSG